MGRGIGCLASDRRAADFLAEPPVGGSHYSFCCGGGVLAWWLASSPISSRKRTPPVAASNSTITACTAGNSVPRLPGVLVISLLPTYRPWSTALRTKYIDDSSPMIVSATSIG
mgnify:CR=1 FL=1